jgi:hypothetical protein
MDLNVFLPASFTGAMANSVDAEGTIAGTMFAADGRRHAAVWIPTKAFRSLGADSESFREQAGGTPSSR